MKQFGKILKFELLGYLKNKIFVGITVFLVVAIAAVMFLPNVIALFKSDDTPDPSERPVMLVYAEDGKLLSLANLYFLETFPDYRVTIAEGGADAISTAVADGEAACGFLLHSASSYTYYVDNLSMYDVNAEMANAMLREVYRAEAMINGGMDPADVLDIMSVEIEYETVTLGKDQAQNFFYTYIMIFALYMVILLYGQMVATNVATEKSSRAMELLVTSASPTSMMFGKVLASCLAGFSQLLLVFGSAILFYNLNRASLTNPIVASIFDMPISLFVYLLVFFILGFLIYAFMFGAVGSTASKLEDINTSVMPITFLFIAAFIVVMFSMAEGSVDNPAMLVASYIPFTSPMAMFTRIAMSTVAWYEIAASVAILVASTVGIGILSARIYRVGVLLYGTPPRLGTLLRTVLGRRR